MLSMLTAFTIAAQLATAAPAQTQSAAPELRGEQLMTALQAGGYTIMLRHARTDRSIPSKETPGYSPPLRADQRNLTAEGEADVRLMSQVVEKYALPIGAVYSSPAYRCVETADAFGRAAVTMALRVFPTTEETAAIVSAIPEPGTNRVISTHHFVIETLVPGIKPGDIGESEAAVVRPLGNGKVELVGRITLSDWQTLAGGAAAAAPTASPAVTHAAPTHAAPHGASATAAQIAIPDTRAGRIAKGYIEVFNSGSAERMVRFIETSLNAPPNRTTEERVRSYTQLWEQHGALAITGIRSSEEDSIEVAFQSKRGEGFVRVNVEPAPSSRATISIGMMGGHR